MWKYEKVTQKTTDGDTAVVNFHISLKLSLYEHELECNKSNINCVSLDEIVRKIFKKKVKVLKKLKFYARQ